MLIRLFLWRKNAINPIVKNGAVKIAVPNNKTINTKTKGTAITKSKGVSLFDINGVKFQHVVIYLSTIFYAILYK